MSADQAPTFFAAAQGRACRRFDATVEVNRTLCREHFLLRLRLNAASALGPRAVPFPPTRPGQFIQLGCRQPDMATDMAAMLGQELEWDLGTRPTLTQPELCGPLAMLRRPFSVAGRGDDAKGTWLEVIHRVVGTGTQWLGGLEPGDAVDLIGPLGNWFDLLPTKSIALLVGGGVGLPPMFYLAEALQQAGWQAVGFVGALTRDLLAVDFDLRVTPPTDATPAPSVTQFARLGFSSVVTTDDGSLGLRGRITAGLEHYLATQAPAERGRTIIFTCGPHPMMHAVAKLAAQHAVACQVCLEQAMACGMGTCQSCVVKIEDVVRPQAKTADGRPWRFRLACTDGPVFDSKDVIW